MSDHQQVPQKIVFWVIWGATLSGVFMTQIIINGGFPSGQNQGSPEFYWFILAAIPIVASTLLRWIVMPKIKNRQALLVCLIIGVALAEATHFIQLLVIGDTFPQTQLSFLILSIFGIGQYMPVYVK